MPCKPAYVPLQYSAGSWKELRGSSVCASAKTASGGPTVSTLKGKKSQRLSKSGGLSTHLASLSFSIFPPRPQAKTKMPPQHVSTVRALETTTPTTLCSQPTSPSRTTLSLSGDQSTGGGEASPRHHQVIPEPPRVTLPMVPTRQPQTPATQRWTTQRRKTPLPPQWPWMIPSRTARRHHLLHLLPLHQWHRATI